jgi:hypothetical protein
MVGWHPSKEVLVSASYDDTVRTWEAGMDTLHPIPYILYPIPYTLYPIPYALCPIPYILYPQVSGWEAGAETQCPKP